MNNKQICVEQVYSMFNIIITILKKAMGGGVW